jgi:hypothetical protein
MPASADIRMPSEASDDPENRPVNADIRFMAVSRRGAIEAEISSMIGFWSRDRERRFNSSIVSADGRG